MSIVRAEADPRDEDDLDIDEFIKDIKKNPYQVAECLCLAVSNLDDIETLLIIQDKDSFCEVFMVKFEEQIVNMATEAAKWEKEQ